jgi:hypothetical protein
MEKSQILTTTPALEIYCLEHDELATSKHRNRRTEGDACKRLGEKKSARFSASRGVNAPAELRRRGPCRQLIDGSRLAKGFLS